MADLRTRALVTDITREVSLLYNEFKEPVALTVLQCRFVQRLQRIFGVGAGFTWLLDQLDEARVLKVLISPTSKRWAVPLDVWTGLGPEGQAAMRTRIRTLVDPVSERARELREIRIKSSRAVK